MPGLGDAGVQRSLRNVLSKGSKQQSRYERGAETSYDSACGRCTCVTSSPMIGIRSTPLHRKQCCSRLELASNKLSAAKASKASALLGVLIQHESSGRSGAFTNDPRRHEGAAAEHALNKQRKSSAANAPRAAQQPNAAVTASSTPADASGHQATAECPLCGSSMPAERLQAHVDAELQELDAAADQASALHSEAITQHARQVLQPITVRPSSMAQPTACLPPRHRMQMAQLRPGHADSSSHGKDGALWRQSDLPERHTLSGASRHCMQPAVQQGASAASSARGCPLPLPQQPPPPRESMQQQCLGVPPVCSSTAAQQGQHACQAPQDSSMQAQARSQHHQSRQQIDHRQPRNLCSRSSAQQRQGAAAHRQMSWKRKAQV